MAIAIAIIGGLAILLHIISAFMLINIKHNRCGRHGAVGALAQMSGIFIKLVGCCILLVSWVLEMALYALSLVSIGGIPVAIIGGLALFLPFLLGLSFIFAILNKRETKSALLLIFSNAALVALYVLALEK